MNKAEQANLELEVFEWMAKQGYDRRASKEIAPIIVKYMAHREMVHTSACHHCSFFAPCGNCATKKDKQD